MAKKRKFAPKKTGIEAAKLPNGGLHLARLRKEVVSMHLEVAAIAEALVEARETSNIRQERRTQMKARFYRDHILRECFGDRGAINVVGPVLAQVAMLCRK